MCRDRAKVGVRRKCSHLPNYFYVLFSLVHFSTDYTVHFSFAISMLHVRLSYVIKVLLTYLLWTFVIIHAVVCSTEEERLSKTTVKHVI